MSESVSDRYWSHPERQKGATNSQKVEFGQGRGGVYPPLPWRGFWDLVEVISLVKKNRKTQKLTDSIILSGFRKDLMGFRKKSLIVYGWLLMDVRV